ncbi:uncharacterized protein BJ212DRAFT_1541707 [Suillus subaureus]|uniref:Uncharacterized protein n=1 Tax=Suillus subaureus TaxID=48587 RepID=A0A9P7JHZ2_9AGAM|nr:uncharacterized protein BJ212DRAFT_1541707 [Suillus subaureus]KAG1822990.1 hypothetical protein BJ212DRAFT_1541707 [Suillus subaureus]
MAARQFAKHNGTTSTSIHNDSVPGSMSRSALTSISDANRTDDLTSMAKLQIATNRDIKIDSYTLSFHGRLLIIEGAETSINYGQRYGLLGENESGKIDIYLLRGETEPSDVNAVDFIVASAREKVAKLEKRIEDLSIADDPHLLLLVEPTNHLDLGAVVWLEEYLSTYNDVLVITSHPQGFIISVCANVMDLTTKNKLVYYAGNHTTCEEETTHIKSTFIASAGTYANLVKQAKSKQNITDKMEAAGLVEKVETPRPLRFHFEGIRKLPPIIAFDEVAFSYSGNPEDYFMDSCVAILGANGTTSKHTALKLAKYSQHSADQISHDKSPIESLLLLFHEKHPEKDVVA